MDIPIPVTDDDSFQYMITHGNLWIAQESITSTDDNTCKYMIKIEYHLIST